MSSDASDRTIGTALEFIRMLLQVLRWRLAASLAAALALAFAEGTGLVLLVPLLATIGLTVDQGPTSRLAAAAAGVFRAAGITPTLPAVLTVFLAVSIAHALLYRTHMLLNPSLEQDVVLHMRRRLYAAVVSARWPFLVQRRMSDLVHAVTIDVDRLGSATYQLLTLLTGLAVTGVYVLLAARLSLALTALVAASGVATLWLLRRRTRDVTSRGDEYTDASRRLFGLVSESIAGVKVAKSLGAEPRDVEIFEQHARTLSARYLDLLRSFSHAKLRLDVASAVLVAVLLLVAVNGLGLSGAGLLVLVLVFARIMPRVMALQEAGQILLGALPSYANVARLVRACELEAEHAGTDDQDRRVGMKTAVSLDRVAFAYQSGANVLSDVTITVRAGSITGVAGASGAGKSTVADLVMGLLRPSGGVVRVDGRVLADDDLRAWRRSIGYVPQDTFLLHDTVRANLLWARPAATETEMWAALEQAAAAGFLRARPEGLDTVVGDRGVRLSGGERQRLALARALILQPNLLILDEATSALDSANEQQILAAVQRLAGTVTVLVITHRLSTLRGADLIYVMDAGRIVECGPWASLASVPAGVFQAMLAAQDLQA